MNKRDLKKGVDILSGTRLLETEDDLKCLELVAERYGIKPEDAMIFALFFASDEGDSDDED